MREEQSASQSKTPIILSWLVILAVVWLLWSGIYKPLVIGLGALSCLLTLYLSHRIGFFNESTSIHVIPRIMGYWWLLFVDIIKSSIDVTRIILDPKLPISPVEVELESAPKGPIGQAILGNSITLSPGTVTIDVYKGRMRIHCLTEESANDMIAGKVNERTAELTEK
ncbi:sodium:proton antiporter [Aliikangiella marina]|uniref:Sodium:proton antiporter n=1 Tax=Aliikangiella marina TaxID=1712262 RepID=A0A545TCI5_9GAMM|nr:Na+/H+ antiporter subunit E [Aliikangiella marina]TQV74925.1 sodium:proton antiporter [Aliikangiella marina]